MRRAIAGSPVRSCSSDQALRKYETAFHAAK
jgi:hypothetical protein